MPEDNRNDSQNKVEPLTQQGELTVESIQNEPGRAFENIKLLREENRKHRMKNSELMQELDKLRKTAESSMGNGTAGQVDANEGSTEAESGSRADEGGSNEGLIHENELLKQKISALESEHEGERQLLLKKLPADLRKTFGESSKRQLQELLKILQVPENSPGAFDGGPADASTLQGMNDEEERQLARINPGLYGKLKQKQLRTLRGTY